MPRIGGASPGQRSSPVRPWLPRISEISPPWWRSCSIRCQMTHCRVKVWVPVRRSRENSTARSCGVQRPGTRRSSPTSVRGPRRPRPVRVGDPRRPPTWRPRPPGPARSCSERGTGRGARRRPRPGVVEPVGPARRHVAGELPDGPQVRGGLQQQLVGREVSERVQEQAVVVRPPVVEGLLFGSRRGHAGHGTHRGRHPASDSPSPYVDWLAG